MNFSNKTYNTIKWIVLTVLPALSVLVGTLGKAYGWDGTEIAVVTINAFTVFLGGIMHLSTATYNKKEGE